MSIHFDTQVCELSSCQRGWSISNAQQLRYCPMWPALRCLHDASTRRNDVQCQRVYRDVLDLLYQVHDAVSPAACKPFHYHPWQLRQSAHCRGRNQLHNVTYAGTYACRSCCSEDIRADCRMCWIQPALALLCSPDFCHHCCHNLSSAETDTSRLLVLYLLLSFIDRWTQLPNLGRT